MGDRIVTRVLVLVLVGPLALVSGCVAAQWTWGSPSSSQSMLLLLPLAYAANLLAILFTQARTRAPTVVTYSLALLTGAILGVAWHPFVVFLIWGTTSLGLLFVIVAIAGSLVGALFGLSGMRLDRHTVGISALCVSAALAVSTRAEPVRSLFLGEKYLTVTFAVWEPLDQELVVKGSSQLIPESDDIALLKEANLHGVVRVVGTSAHGTGYRVHMLIVVRQPLLKQARLAWPTYGRIAYIQDEQLDFRPIPTHVDARRDSTLLLYPDPSWPRTVLYRAEGPAGAAAGVAFTWPE